MPSTEGLSESLEYAQDVDSQIDALLQDLVDNQEINNSYDRLGIEVDPSSPLDAGSPATMMLSSIKLGDAQSMMQNVAQNNTIPQNMRRSMQQVLNR